ncbi:DUF3304 domain-containing protein [Erwinia pyri]|uniref:DUF3304 domain-containing protein n=1 Tax=Erwinia pyri TaxID=3062598 RepID=A0AA50DHX8_9GAMM|nr:DUF3304 domain-containing protein [Erwinia sp. DE2]WLS78364.1 DUF3304 domain-containing protein [Erwinia sp. DE2]
MMQGKSRLLLLAQATLTLTGCEAMRPDDTLAGDVDAYNHTAKAINWFRVNGAGAPGMNAYGESGGACCIAYSRTWTPGLKARVEWEADPNPYEIIPRVKQGAGFEPEAYARHAVKYQHFVRTVDIPRYGPEGTCGITVHFLPCDQVEVTQSCHSPNHPDSLIKYPRKMKEPATCPRS